ncbi:MAG TPA: hypothetical protein VN654_25015, partial [Vicinamibacterales bacterium]|nr:hypothetical protein [Vicinamibacterales bacterium]
MILRLRSRAVLPACLAAVCLAAACRGTQGASPAAGAGARALTVRVASVTARDVVYEIKAPGTLEAEELVQITAQVEGVAADMRFHEGDRVGRSTVLMRIDPDRYRLELERAEATYQKGLADARRAAADAARREQLARENLVAAEELNRARQESERLAADAPWVPRQPAARQTAARQAGRTARLRSLKIKGRPQAEAPILRQAGSPSKP